jgi:hypothetical protein
VAAVKSFAVANIDNVLADVYEVPASKSAIVFDLTICNKSGGDLLMDVTLIKATGSITVYLAFAVAIKAGQTIFVLGDTTRKGLMAGDKLQVRATTGTNVLDASGSVLEEDL